MYIRQANLNPKYKVSLNNYIRQASLNPKYKVCLIIFNNAGQFEYLSNGGHLQPIV